MTNDESIERRVAREARLFSPWLGEDESPHFREMCELFAGQLFHMTEFSWSPGSDDAGIMLKGGGPQFSASVRDFLQKAGIHEKGLSFFDESAALAPGSDLSLKVDFSKGGRAKASFYYHNLLGLPAVNGCMAGLGIDERSRALFFGEICFLLRRERLFAGFGVSDKDRVVVKTFFMHRTAESRHYLSAGISASMAMLRFPAKTISLFIDLHGFLAADPKRSVFTSYGFTTELQPVVKIDYEDIDLDRVMDIFSTFRVPESESEKLRSICAELGSGRVTYFSLRFNRDGDPSFKCYFTRRYALMSDPGNIAGLFSETTWTEGQ